MLRDLRWVSLVEVFSRAASFVTVPLLTRALVPEQYGSYKAVFFVLSLFFLLYGLGSFGTVLQKRLPEIGSSEQARLVVASVIGTGVLLGVTWLLLSVAIHLSLIRAVSPQLQTFLQNNGLLVGLLFFSMPLFRLSLSISRGVDRFERYSIVKSVRECLFLVTIVGLFWTQTLTVRTAIAAMAGATIAGTLVGGLSVRSHLFVSPNFESLSEQLRLISLPLVPKTVLKKVNGTAPELVVLGVFGPSVFAAWSVLFAFTSVFQLVSGPFSQLLLPKISERRSEGQSLTPIVSRYYRLMVVVMAPAIVGSWLLGPEIIRYVFGERYFYGLLVTGVVLTGFGTQTVNALSGHFFVGTDEALYETYNNGLSTVVLLSMVVLGGVLGSLLIVALGYLLANVASLAFSLWYQRSVVDLQSPSVATVMQLSGGLVTMSVAVVVAAPLISSVETVLAVVGFGAITYFSTLVLVGFVSEDDLSIVRRFIGVA